MAGSNKDLRDGLRSLQAASERLLDRQRKANDFIEARQLEASKLVCDAEDSMVRTRETDGGPERQVLTDKVKNLSDGLQHVADQLDRTMNTYEHLFPTQDGMDFGSEESIPMNDGITQDVRANVTTTHYSMQPVVAVRTDHLDELLDQYNGSFRPPRATPPPPTDIWQTRLEPNTQLNVLLSWVDSPSLFWVQQITEIASTVLANQLKEAPSWSNIAGPLTVGQFVAAPQDEMFYRAKVMSLAANSAGIPFAKVLYIDYGNTGWVAESVIKQLPAELYFYDWQAFGCRLTQVAPMNGESWTTDEMELFSNMLKEVVDNEEISKDMTIVVESVHSNDGLISLEVALTTRAANSQENVGAAMITAGCQTATEGRYYNRSISDSGPPETPEPWQVIAAGSRAFQDSAEEPNTSAELVRISVPSVPTGSQFQAQLVKYYDPGYFFITAADSVADLCCFQDQINQFCQTDLPPRFLEGGAELDDLITSACLVKAADGQFYRAEVLRHATGPVARGTIDLDEDAISLGILYVDYGLEDWTSAGNAFKIPDIFAAIPQYSIRCRLARVKPLGTEWSAEVDVKFNELIGRTDLKVEKLGQSDGSLEVALFVPTSNTTKSFSDCLVEQQLAARSF